MEININHKAIGMTENEKIISILQEMGATTPETAIPAEKIIEKGIEEGLTEDYFTEHWHGYKEGDHHWWQRLAAMMGIGEWDQVELYNEPYLHREEREDIKEDTGRKTHRMFYWWDETHQHDNRVSAKKESFEQVVKKMIKMNKSNFVKVADCTDTNLKEMVKSQLNKKNIPYLLETRNGHNILTVQVIKEFFLYIPLNNETADDTIGLVPYFLNRVDMVKKDYPEIQVVKNKVLASKWKELTAIA